MKDRQGIPDRKISDLWTRGKFWEIFGFSSGDFTTLELAKQYSALAKAHSDNPEVKRMIEEAFATLNTPLTRQFYEGCRMLTQRIRHEIGEAQFANVEDRIWSDLWNWVSERWQEPPEELINAIKTKYSHPSGSGATRQTQIWSDEGLKAADLDSVMAAEAFAKQTKCQSCGKFDHTLRVVAFPYVVSILIASFRRAGEAGIFCHRCRCSKSIKWAIVSLLFGWWSIWGFFWNIGALIDNFRGGKMPREHNDPLIARLAWAHMVLGKIAEAKTALAELLKHGLNEEALQLKRELDTRYPEVSLVKTGEFRLGYLTVVFAILGVYVIAGIAMFGGTSTPVPSSPQVTPSFTPPAQSTQAPVITPSPTPQPSTKFARTYADVLAITFSLLDDVSIQTKKNQSDQQAMINLRDKLIKRDVGAGLVTIDSRLGAVGNLDACVAVRTSDRDIVFLSVVPSDVTVENEDERLQFVYLEKGKRIGLIPAKFAASNDYSWYENYLEETYVLFDLYKWLEGYSDVVERNYRKLEQIDAKNEEIRRWIESPPLVPASSPLYSVSDVDWANREFDRLIDLGNARIDRYNHYLTQFNAQVDDLDKEIAAAEKLAKNYPNEIFYVEEYSMGLTIPYQPIPTFPSLIFPVVPPAITPIYTSVDSFLSALASKIAEDDSYNQVEKPDKSMFKVQRWTDKNFVVTGFEVRW